MEKERELVIFGTFYLKMEEDETQEEAEKRFLNKLHNSGIDWLDYYESRIQNY